MAGKHDGVVELKEDAVPVYPGYRDDRAYSEGRQSLKQGDEPGGNPHLAGTPEADAWDFGYDNGLLAKEQRQTCWSGGT